EELGDRGDILTQMVWRSARAKIVAARGRADEGEALAREAVGISESTDFVSARADALVDLAQVLRDAGRTQEASEAANEGLALYERKGNSVAAGKIRADLAVLM